MGPGPAARPARAASAALLCAALLLLLLLLPPTARGAGERRRLACSTCRGIVDRFNQGLADTAKKNFGGGNTAWEEKTLSKYESSEIRLVEIIENLCDSSNFECNNMVEEHEEHIEKWWFKLKKKYPDLFKWFCIETIEVCCPAGTYGPDCLACRGGSERPCHGNGHCDGDGTRGGDGSCSCNKEYTGEFCLDCSSGYFSTLRNETHSVCTGCDASCVGCTGEGSDKCKTCASGYVKEDEKCTGEEVESEKTEPSHTGHDDL
ncbi:Cysteine-rich with EGF-like domain protein 2-B [Pitangus sulphuratus]|nr:Cysteine-rich with EGF-like domain protein 2-B [Pitangus sulphuratus]